MEPLYSDMWLSQLHSGTLALRFMFTGAILDGTRLAVGSTLFECVVQAKRRASLSFTADLLSKAKEVQMGFTDAVHNC